MSPGARQVQALAESAERLSGLQSSTDAILAYDEAINAYLNLAPDERDRPVTEKITWCVWNRAMLLDGSHWDTPAVVNQLIAVLGDVSTPAPPAELLDPSPGTDEEIAAELAELYNGQFWLELATSGTDRPSLQRLARRAMQLYDSTARWLTSEDLEENRVRAATVWTIRQIADGYAMYSGIPNTTERAQLSGPLRISVEDSIRRDGIDQWAAQHGHLLHLPDSEESQAFADEMIEQILSHNRAFDPDLRTHFLKSLRLYEMLAALTDSATGRDAIRTGGTLRFGIGQINTCRNIIAIAIPSHPDTSAALIACHFIAQAHYTAAFDRNTSSREIFPQPAFLRQLLRQAHTGRWLDQEGIELPAWLAGWLAD